MTRQRPELNFDVTESEQMTAMRPHRSISSDFPVLVAAFDKSRKPCAKIDVPDGRSIQGVRAGLALAAKKHKSEHGPQIRCVTRNGTVYLVRTNAAGGE